MKFLLLFLACLFFSVQFVFSKSYERKTADSTAASLWFIIIAAASGCIIFWTANGFKLELTVHALIWAAVYAAANVGCSIGNIAALRRGDLATVTIWVLLGGTLIPTLYGTIILGEHLSLLHLISLIIMVISLFTDFFFKREKQTAKAPISFFVFCLIAFAGNGLVSVATKAHEASVYAIDSNSFIVWSNIFTLLFSIIWLIAIPQKNRFSGMPEKKYLLKPVLFACAYTVANGIANLFSLSCAKQMDSSLQFPVISASVIVLNTLSGRIFFKEKPNRSTVLRVILSVIGVILCVFANS